MSTTAQLAVETCWHDRQTGSVIVPAGELVYLVTPREIQDEALRRELQSILEHKQKRGEQWRMVKIRDWHAVVSEEVFHAKQSPPSGWPTPPVSRRTDSPLLPELRTPPVESAVDAPASRPVLQPQIHHPASTKPRTLF